MDVPKTGDDANLALWISLMCVGLAGAGVTVFFYLRKRRKDNGHIAAEK